MDVHLHFSIIRPFNIPFFYILSAQIQNLHLSYFWKCSWNCTISHTHLYSNTTVKETFWTHQTLVVFFDLCQKEKRLEKRCTFLILGIFVVFSLESRFFNELFCVKITDFCFLVWFKSKSHQLKIAPIFLSISRKYNEFLCVSIKHCCTHFKTKYFYIALTIWLNMHRNCTTIFFELHNLSFSQLILFFSNYKANKIFTFNLSTSIRNQ